jgi:hypothetical protein
MGTLALLLGLFLALLFSWVFDDVEADHDIAAQEEDRPF